MSPSSARSYDGVAVSFHWLVVFLVVIQFATKLIPPGSMTEGQLNAWHLAIGPTILIVMLLRLAWRVTHAPPEPPADLAPALKLLSRVTHWAFYVILIVLPILGWLSASGYGARPTLLGLVPLPMLVGKDKATGEFWGGAHGTLAWVLLAVILLHICGAVYHLAVKQDGVMGRMLPGVDPGPP